MAEYDLSSLADHDLADIADFSIDQFGIEQARQYRDGLKICSQTLADTLRIGRNGDELASGLKRYAHQSHVVFCKPAAKAVHIVRVLHNGMDVARHF